MKKSAVILWVIALVASLSFFGCEGLDDDYSTDPNLTLSFSSDTLSFDTVFTTVGSTTGKFMVYNKNKDNLQIESLMLASGGTSGFRLNVDGRKGTSFNNMIILGKDSMYVFVEVTVNPTGYDAPILIEDSVIFTVNGMQQSVRLEAYGQDVHIYKGGKRIDSDLTLSADKPYLIYDSLVIAPQTTVTVQAGATFYMHSQANLIVHGTLICEGTEQAPVIFRGDRSDDILQDILPYDRTPAQWGGIFFKNESFGNQMKYCIVRNGTTGITCEQSEPTDQKLNIDESQITNAEGNLFSAINCNVTATSSEFTNAGGNVVTIVGGSCYFAHCTIANFMTLVTRGSSSDSGESLSLHLVNNATVNAAGPFPIKSAAFHNCIIDGNYDVTTSGGEIAITSDGSSDFDYRFNHCVLKMKTTEDSHFTNDHFITESLVYQMKGSNENQYGFDFRMDTVTNVSVGAADPVIAAQYPIDRYGVSRTTGSHAPTIGAYEFVKKEE